MGRQREFKEHKRSDRRIRERISAGYRRCGMARTQGNNIQVWGVTREVHGEDVVQMVKQVIRPGIMEKNWRRWKGKKPTKREMMKTIPEEEEIEEEKSGVRE